MAKEQQLAELDRQLMMAGIGNLPGVFFVAGGLLGKFAEPGEVPFQFLLDPNISTVLLAVGGASLVWFSVTIISLTKAKIRIHNGERD